MKAAILAIGNELLLGRTLNTNAFELSRRLTEIGFEVHEHRAVADDTTSIETTISALASSHDFLVITGGLGPTRDDLTRQCIANLLQTPLIAHPPAETWLRQFYQSRNVPVNPQLLTQTCLPANATPLMNPKGSALGFMVRLENCQVFVLPGIPSEARAMFEEHVVPLLQQVIVAAGTPPRQLLTCRFIGVTESHVDNLAATWHQQMVDKGVRDLSWGTQIRFPEVHVIFYATAAAAHCFNEIKALAAGSAGSYLIDFDETLPETMVHNLLIGEKLKLAVAESCTGGYLASRLLAQAGASDYFVGGVVCYANAAKISPLGVSPDTLHKYGAVSQECAREMAEQVRQIHQADIGVAITGILGPGGGTYDKPVGTAFAGFAAKKRPTVIDAFQLKRDRLLNREELTVRVLFRLYQFVTTLRAP